MRRYPRQNGLTVALRELGRIERTLFILDLLQSVELRRRVHAGLNKDEARNTLTRAVFFNRLGEVRDRATLPGQRPQPGNSCNRTVEHGLPGAGTQGLADAGRPVYTDLYQYFSPQGWEHINLTAHYIWRQSRRLEDGKYRPLRKL